jgi:predicted outer membrane protein
MKVLLLAMAVAGLASCGSGTGEGDVSPKDSQMVAEHVDPSTNFPAEVIQPDTLKTDASFVKNAAASGEELAGLAELAIRKAAAPEVKKLAQKIATDQHALQNAARTIKQPPVADSSASYTDSSREELEKLSGKVFDKQWVEKMTLKYTALISRYESEREVAKDKSLKQFVHAQLPVLLEHQQQLEACRNKLQ